MHRCKPAEFVKKEYQVDESDVGTGFRAEKNSVLAIRAAGAVFND
jgi:hypothetical protein